MKRFIFKISTAIENLLHLVFHFSLSIFLHERFSLHLLSSCNTQTATIICILSRRKYQRGISRRIRFLELSFHRRSIPCGVAHLSRSPFLRFLPSSIGQSYVSGLARPPVAQSRGDNLAGSHERGAIRYPAIGIKRGIGNANISFSVLAATSAEPAATLGRKRRRQGESEREGNRQRRRARGGARGGQSVAGGTSGTTWW